MTFTEMVVDNFAGGGGASTGIRDALGREADVAINHDPEAIAMHCANHPTTLHLTTDVFAVDPLEVTGGRPVGLAWFSPDCTHFSKAKGGKPRDKNIRGLAWVVIDWAKAVRPRVIMLENVEEFQTWGPLDDDGYPIKARSGETFAEWRGQLEALGYRVEFRMLRACDYGTPTIRRRLFMVARCDDSEIRWPKPTHGKGGFAWLCTESIACTRSRLPAQKLSQASLEQSKEAEPARGSQFGLTDCAHRTQASGGGNGERVGVEDGRLLILNEPIRASVAGELHGFNSTAVSRKAPDGGRGFLVVIEEPCSGHGCDFCRTCRGGVCCLYDNLRRPSRGSPVRASASSDLARAARMGPSLRTGHHVARSRPRVSMSRSPLAAADARAAACRFLPPVVDSRLTVLSVRDLGSEVQASLIGVSTARDLPPISVAVHEPRLRYSGRLRRACSLQSCSSCSSRSDPGCRPFQPSHRVCSSCVQGDPRRASVLRLQKHQSRDASRSIRSSSVISSGGDAPNCWHGEGHPPLLLGLLRAGLSARAIPVRALALRADFRPVLPVTRYPFVLAARALEALDHDVWHSGFTIPSTPSPTVNYIPKGLPISNPLATMYLQGKWRGVEMDAREQRGIEIAERLRIRQEGDGWIVPSQNGDGRYTVRLAEQRCSCPDHQLRRMKCKHIFAVEYAVRREAQPDGTETVTESVRVTYSQDWTAYNAAQTEEGERLPAMLANLCGLIPQPEQTNGRPRLPLAEMTFASVMKVYSGFSSRRFASELRAAHDLGLIEHVPHFNSVSNYLSDETMTPILKDLIEVTALPLRGVEHDFAVDSSGFSTSGFVRWYSKKHEGVQDNHEWVKAHIAVGVETHIVTAIEVSDWTSNDNPYLPALVGDTAAHFDVREVSADKQYLGRSNLNAIEAIGAVPFVPFRTNSVVRKSDGQNAWWRMYHYFTYRREEFLTHYHKRSNVESTFHMIKSKFGSAVRSKSHTGQVNEVLAKVLCHNLCVLILAMHEIGLTEAEVGICTKRLTPAQEVRS